MCGQQVQDTSTSPTLSRVLTAGLNKNGSLKSDKSESSGGVESLCQEMSDLMHDFELMRRISSLISQLKGSYSVSLKNPRVGEGLFRQNLFIRPRECESRLFKSAFISFSNSKLSCTFFFLL